MTTRRKFFSINEANILIPQIEELLGRLTKKKEVMERLHDELFISELLQEASPNKTEQEKGKKQLDSGANEVDASITELEEDLAKIRSLGCILRNIDAGWVEFPAVHQDVEVYFCWKRGEATVCFYRPLHAQFSERLPL
jgi:hypothetical protein